MAPRPRCSTALVAALTSFAACAAAPARLERTRVVWTDVAHGQTLTLQNSSAAPRAEVYRDPAGDSKLKVVDDEQMQKLVAVLDAQGLREHAAAAPLPGARAVLVVELGDRRLVWSRPQVAPNNLDAVAAFDKGLRYVIAVYNETPAYHTRRVDDPELTGLRKAIDAEKQKPLGPGQ